VVGGRSWSACACATAHRSTGQVNARCSLPVLGAVVMHLGNNARRLHRTEPSALFCKCTVAFGFVTVAHTIVYFKYYGTNCLMHDLRTKYSAVVHYLNVDKNLSRFSKRVWVSTSGRWIVYDKSNEACSTRIVRRDRQLPLPKCSAWSSCIPCLLIQSADTPDICLQRSAVLEL
jgi:hypothetical protein